MSTAIPSALAASRTARGVVVAAAVLAAQLSAPGLRTAAADAADAVQAGAATAIARRSWGSVAATRIASRSLGSSTRATPSRHRPAENIRQRRGLDEVRLQRTQRYRALIEHHGRLNDVDTELVKAIVYTESGGDARAESPQGARGLMQLMPATARAFGARDLDNPEQSIASGTRYLRHLLDRFGATELALWAYNAGPDAVARGRMPAETRDYVPRVLAVRRMLRTLNADAGRE